MNRLLKQILAVFFCSASIAFSSASGAVVTATFNAATDVPVTAASYTATGNTVEITLNFAPPVGTSLMLVKNTGLSFVDGTFGNLAQGQVVLLRYRSASYRFVANYFGGTGNDLVLQWEGNKVCAWGDDSSKQLGINDFALHRVPFPVDSSGLLAGKSIVAVSNGENHSLALCSDGTLASWGSNLNGQLGTGTFAASGYPVAVDLTGVLARKTVISIAAGSTHNLALCSDNTLVAWGNNNSGQLGNGTTISAIGTPVSVSRTGILSGKTVIAIAAGDSQSLALCSDGTLAAWGANYYGALGNGGTDDSNVPVAVTRTGILSGKTVTAIASGYSHFVALCSDGTLAVWGANSDGQLGNGKVVDSNIPVGITTTGVLAGKTIAAIAAGYQHSVVLCKDGTIATWGDNSHGELGNGNTTSSKVPVLVVKTGVLSGKTITGIASGISWCFASCSDGTLTSWGYNSAGQLGNGNLVDSKVPVVVSTSSLATGEKINLANVSGGGAHATAIVSKPLSDVSTLASLTITPGSLSPLLTNGVTSYTALVPHGTASLSVSPVLKDPNASLAVNGLPLTSGSSSAPIPATPGTTISITVTAQNGTTVTTYSVTIRDDTSLSSLAVSSGSLSPAFVTNTLAYIDYISPTTTSVTLTPQASDPSATIRVNGSIVVSGAVSSPINLQQGSNPVSVVVAGLDGSNTTYTINFIRQSALEFTYTSGSGIPVTASSYVATARTANLSLNYPPAQGTNLTVVKNTGNRLIEGRFSNLAQGQVVVLTYNNSRYKFVANYYGGTGNDLVLQWAHNRIYAWGFNTYGQLGTGTVPSNSSSAIPVFSTGVLANKTITSIAGGFNFSLALCSDGTLFTWGDNSVGQLGNGTTSRSNIPVAVSMDGAFAGKTPIAISAGSVHCMVLCSDGSLVSWGGNSSGELGIGTTVSSTIPKQIPATGLLSTKIVTDISAGIDHNLVRCDDGTLLSWGDNSSGQLGTSSNVPSITSPAAVDTSGALSGKTPIAFSAGYGTSLVACSDGTLVVWGRNYDAELGNGSYNPSYTSIPVKVPVTAAISGKIITVVSAGNQHNLVLCSDGTMASWGGSNSNGELGNGTTTKSLVPVSVITTGLLSGKSITHISANLNHDHVLCSDGTLASWGYSQNLGNGSNSNSSVPVAASIPSGVVFTNLSRGPRSSHNLAVGALPLSNNSSLSGLVTTSGPLDTAFSSSKTTYTSIADSGMASATVTPTSADPDAIISVNGKPVASGTASSPIGILPGNNSVVIEVTAETGVRTVYTLTIIRPPLSATFDSAASVPATASNYSPKGNTVNFSLKFVPAPGTILKVIDNTGLALFDGPFANLAQGQRVALTYAGITYDFVANYYGENGNDLVLQWATTKLFAWGSNNYGQLGDGSTTQRLRPTAVTDNGALAGKTITSIAEGYLHSTALSADGTLVSWGYNIFGLLGNGGNAASSVPVEVVQSSPLVGKLVIAISSGPFHNLALCSDGTVAAWGYNNYGQLGTGDKVTARSPVLVSPSGALSGKQVVALAAGTYNSFALCSDGTVVGWGYNDEGELGDNTTTSSLIPVAVSTTGALSGKKVMILSAGAYHTLALCTDGTLVSWGYNANGQLGNNSTSFSKVPVAIQSSGSLAGKTVTALASGGSHSLALCSDGSLSAWGSNARGQLGSTGDSQVPRLVDLGSMVTGKFISRIAAGSSHSSVTFTDGTAASWGGNSNGQLANNSTTGSSTPEAIDATAFASGSRLMDLSTGSASNHVVGLLALPSARASARLISAPINEDQDLADPDHDGICNLLEYAFGLNPNADSSGLLPQPVRSDASFSITFVEPNEVVGLIYGAEWSPSLLPGSWISLPDTGTGRTHSFSLPTETHPKAFIRLKVTRP